MSMDYWMVFGIGFDMQDLMPYLDPEKLRQKLAEKQIFFSEQDVAPWEKADIDGRIALLEKYNDSSFGFADLVAEADTELLLSFGNDGDDGHYLYYEPSYPWDRKEKECESEEAAREYLCNVAMCFALDDTPREDILGQIHEINQVGMG